ncbi:MAG: tRNA glutamyl-Q(34) synthetase GluQRS [Oscillospiraceae bacterium]|nr:tRNA glutamyl-Q(34) synthetase GluQRS [Oscillospiraceae bacterium]
MRARKSPAVFWRASFPLAAIADTHYNICDKEVRDTKDTVGRFAPTPSGLMHLGNITCFFLAWISAKNKGGRIILRNEDLDAQRCSPKWAERAERDLQWLGLTFDEGGSLGGPSAPYFQSGRSELYLAALEKLKATGLVYPCFCTRSELHAASAPHMSDGITLYAGTCRNLTPEQVSVRIAETGRQPAMRLRVPDERISFTDGNMGKITIDLARECGDFLLRRSDGVFAYQLAVVVDDAAMGVTEVVRGADLLSSTPWQIYLYRLLGLKAPEFYHIPIVLGANGKKLSKRDGSDGIDALKAVYSPEEVVGKLAYLIGQNPAAKPMTAAETARRFSWHDVPRSGIVIPEGLF